MRLRPFGRKPKREHYLGEYTEPSFRGAFVMLVLSVVAVALLWLAYSWALNQPEIHDPNGVIDGVRASIGAVAIWQPASPPPPPVPWVGVVAPGRS